MGHSWRTSPTKLEPIPSLIMLAKTSVISWRLHKTHRTMLIIISDFLPQQFNQIKKIKFQHCQRNWNVAAGIGFGVVTSWSIKRIFLPIFLIFFLVFANYSWHGFCTYNLFSVLSCHFILFNSLFSFLSFVFNFFHLFLSFIFEPPFAPLSQLMDLILLLVESI